MRISDWSSDVYSSDLIIVRQPHRVGAQVADQRHILFMVGPVQRPALGIAVLMARYAMELERLAVEEKALFGVDGDGADAERLLEIGRASWRERVCQYV